MNRLKRMALIGLLVQKLKENHSWCGETHIQKSIYFLQELFDIPLNYNFILYKFGPFSFDLRDDLSECMACELIDAIPDFYGPHLYPTDYMKKLMTKFPKTLQKYSSQVDFIAEKLGPKNVSQLERLSTALYVAQKYPDLTKNEDNWLEKVHQLKPHQSKERISQAIKELQTLIWEARLKSLKRELKPLAKRAGLVTEEDVFEV